MTWMRGVWIVVCASALMACKRTDKTTSGSSAQSAPWPAGDARTSEASTLSHFRVAEGQELQVALPAREGEPRARLSGIRGELWVDDGDVTRSHGWLEFDLARLTLLSEGGEPDVERTRIAQEWLGPWTTPQHQVARLEISSLAASSSRRFDQGDRVSLGNQSSARRIRATLTSRLTVRRVATDQRISVIADLIETDGPGELRVRLHPRASISLLEHDIVPRDAHGVPVAKDRPLLGKVVGTRAFIAGELRWIPAP